MCSTNASLELGPNDKLAEFSPFSCMQPPSVCQLDICKVMDPGPGVLVGSGFSVGRKFNVYKL